MASRVGSWGASQVTRFVVGTGTCVDAGVGVCVVAECNVGDVDGVVAWVGGTLFPFLSLGDHLPSDVTTISRVTGDRRRFWAI